MTSPVNHKKYSILVKSMDDQFQLNIQVREQETISYGIPRITDGHPKIREELRARKVKLTDDPKGPTEIGMLIGGDWYAKLRTCEQLQLDCGVLAINTKLGWTLLGSVNEPREIGETANLCLSMSVCDTTITKLWELDVLGIREPSTELEIQERGKILRDNFVKSIKRDQNGRYSIKLPWKENIPSLPSNRDVAYKRLQSATRKLLQQGMFQAYNIIFSQWESEGFIERVPPAVHSRNIHYLPHRPVIKSESLTTPVRPVFDASCRTGKSPSLNDCLLTGENYVLLIPEVMQRFREKKVGFVSDIRKAFQMIGVEEEDRDVMRFLWWRDNNMEDVIEYRHSRVMFGATCSPFILAAVLFHHLTNLPDEDTLNGHKLLDTLYVDNCVSSENTREEYQNFKKSSIDIMKRAEMDLRMWQSNIDELEDDSSPVISVLGLQWEKYRDELYVNVKNITIPDKISKRVILSTVQKIFDPIGFTCPCLLPMKMLLQKTWLRKLKWDEALPEEDSNRFLKWCEEAKHLDEIRIPRLSTGGVTDKSCWEIHTFTDASQDAYSAVVYLRTEEEGLVSVQLLAAKSHVSPTKPMTIPKLEVMGCLIGARLTTSTKKALKIENVRERFWCDSQVAIAWIRRKEQWGTFVANRTKEINELTRAEDWRHVKGSLNPADLPSRGCFPSELARNKWWQGPSWLYEDESSWPKSSEEVNEEEVMSEKKRVTSTNIVMSFSVIDRVRNSHKFVSYVRIVGWVRRFLHNKLVKNTDMRKRGALTDEEIRKAEIIFIREMQREAFPVEARCKLSRFKTVEDEWGVLKVKSRLTYRSDPIYFRYPILLPHKREEVMQLIRDFHWSNSHAGVGMLMTIIRERFWITKARQTIKKVISKCHRCRRYSAKNIIPEAAPLPLNRVKDAEVFEVVGVDLAGPLILKNGGKAWFVIFTCGIYRAVHFELVKKISTAAFICALEKFCEKYRRPAIIYSDNGTNFRGTENLFRKIDWSLVSNPEKVKKIEWRFNPVTSSWWGGWWERLIRTAKDLLKRTVGKGSLSWNELKAILKTVAEVMNSRPLTYVSENANDLEPLTPSLFLHPFGNASFPESELTDAEKLRVRWSYVNMLRKELKGRFVKEYLAMLVNRYPKKVTRKLTVGEIVLVGCDNLKRIHWPLGRVIELKPGPDGVCRIARVKTEKDEITRSVQRLFPLEADRPVSESSEILRDNVVTRSGRTIKCPERFQ